jgi:DNA-binding beta-propeller fold protein YncE
VTSGCGQALKTVRVGPIPVAIAIDQSSDTVYVANNGINSTGDTVSVIDGATCNGTQSSGCGQVQTITVGEGPNWIALDAGTHTAYTANQMDDSVSVINTATCNATVTSGCDQKTLDRPCGRQSLGAVDRPEAAQCLRFQQLG